MFLIFNFISIITWSPFWICENYEIEENNTPNPEDNNPDHLSKTVELCTPYVFAYTFHLDQVLKKSLQFLKHILSIKKVDTLYGVLNVFEASKLAATEVFWKYPLDGNQEFFLMVWPLSPSPSIFFQVFTPPRPLLVRHTIVFFLVYHNKTYTVRFIKPYRNPVYKCTGIR